MLPRPPVDDVRRLRMSVDWAMRQTLSQEEIVPMLQRLARTACPGSDDFSFAHRHLAELSVESEPWHAALSARQVVARCPDDDRAWAILGLSYSLLGHFRAAATAYRRALAIAPSNPWYAHNLGHLIDVALDRPHEAIPFLAGALSKEPREVEIATSYARALARVGRVEEAAKLLRQYIRNGGTTEQKALLRWFENGAPRSEEVAPPKPRRPRTGNVLRAARKRSKPAPTE